MRRWLKRSVSLFFIVFFGILSANAAWADCATTEIDVLGDGTQCETAKFTVTTTSDTTQFNFEINAAGTFYIDWGDGSAVETISNATVDDAWLLHDYDDEGEYTIRLGGVATAYESSIITTTIAFSTNESIASVSGSLATLFPQFGSNLGEYPIFDSTFYYATNLTSVPSGLFSGGNLVGGANMFSATFYHSGLTSIPSGLFNGINTGAEYMFDQTFAGCTNLTSIPVGLFSSITSGAEEMFYSTFYGCTTLTAIPPRLFAGITTAASGMFDRTFYNCSSLSGYIPPSAFAGLIANGHPTASGMWGGTFYGTNLATSCTSPLTQYTSGYEGTGNNTWEGRVSCSRTCAAGEIDVYGDGSQCETSKFEITTTSDTTRFYFTMRAAGTFYIDWGDGSPVQILTYASAGNSTGVSHTFPSSGSYTIRFGGLGTSYPGCGGDQSTLDFTNNGWYQAKVASVSGSLGALLPQYGTAYGQYPCFLQQFNGCTNLTSIPSTLFSGITGGVGYMFYTTFSGCTNLTSIPAGLFDDVTTGATSQFALTFKGCTKLTNIPDGLFSNITTVTGSNLFNETFRNCTALTSLPENLFSGITTAHERLFSYAFDGCTNLSGAIPLSTFSGLLNNNTPVNSNMFSNTFTNTALNTSCGANEVTYAVYKPYWNGKVVCRAACPSGQIATGTTGCEAEKFSLTTTSDTTSFSFNMTARGTFYVDWGDGSVQTIVRSNNNQATYSHTYSTAGAYTIRFGGTATLYTTTNYADYRGAAIGFYYPSTGTQAKIASVSGSLGALMPILGSADNQKPKFEQTFMNATNLTALPSGLFSGLTGGAYMFDATFQGCTGLTTIAPDLFEDATTGAVRMFRYTFQNCTGLTAIPDGLFSYTTTSADRLFHGTFAGCTGLTTLPENLFSGLNNATGYMFYNTFYGCTNLGGFIPPSFVAGLVSHGSPKPGGIWQSTFVNTALLTECPAGYAQYITGYEGDTTSNYWGGKVSCQTCAEAGMFDINGTCEEPKFTATLNIPSTSVSSRTFKFWSSAVGTFYVDWGDGNVETITRNNTTKTEYSHVYSTGGTYTVKFGGLATAYGTADDAAAITFTSGNDNYASRMTAVTGSLSAIFPQYGTTAGTYPKFISTFNMGRFQTVPDTLFTGLTGGASMFGGTFASTSLTSVPADLFADVEDAADSLFSGTFSGSSLTTVPAALFSRVTGAAENLFAYVFSWSNMTTIPSGLFAGVDGAADGMFQSAFEGCSNLTSIPSGLFDGVDDGADDMFSNAFYDCTSLTSIPSGLFANVAGGGGFMFAGTFGNTAITTIPSGLFGNVVAAPYMFYGTFEDCSNLTAIPSDLFSGITAATSSLFNSTFSGCTNLSGYIPPTTFAGLIANGSPVGTSMWDGTFTNTQVATTCPSDMVQYITGYEGSTNGNTWNGKVSCQTCADAGWISAGTECIEPKFSVTTTHDTSNFVFSLSAKGTFYVDWGDGSAVQTITRSDTTVTDYSHTYTNAGEYTIKFAGAGTGYSGNQDVTTISFYKASGGAQDKIASISGSLGALFPYNGASGYTAYPQFVNTFKNATHLTSIPAGLFGNLNASWYMFSHTFEGCTGLTSIPETLFSNIRVTKSNVFNSTFAGCTGLTSIPENLFSRITNLSSAYSTFASTFRGCTGLTTIPAGLFRNITTITSGENVFSYMFADCTGLTTIPAGLFSSLPSGLNGMFSHTFDGCTGLTSIPDELFAGFTTGVQSMFAGTFWGCTGLTALPSNLFANIRTATQYTFRETFRGCSGLRGYVPTTFFAGLIANGSPTADMTNIFINSGLLTACPAGYTQYITGYESYWSSKVSCEPCPAGTYKSGSGNGACPVCPVGTYMADTGATSCTACTNTKPAHSSYSTSGGTTNTCDWECDSGYINTGTSCEESKFSVTTTDDTSNFVFSLSAKGTFYVDWGDGNVQTITRSDATTTEYTHTYTTAGARTIRFGGTPTGYAGYPTTAISFYKASGGTQDKIVAIDGSLGALFPVVNSSVPGFKEAFRGTSITSIPAGLFSGITTGKRWMFYDTFADCTSLTTIPSGLFSGITNNEQYMFAGTFENCTSLTTIPSGLFSYVTSTSNATNMFEKTFSNCTSLATIPSNLFSGITTGAENMFDNTFYNCTSLVTIPTGLFSNITTGANNLFKQTFYQCRALTTIPSNLFSGITTGVNTQYMFKETFRTCTSLTTIPSGLFSNVVTGGDYMFNATFNGCSALTTIPSNLFSGVTTVAPGMFNSTFAYCTSLRTIPSGLFSSITTGSTGLFIGTFIGCSQLSRIPTDLFSNVTTAADYMFNATFSGCSNLRSYIPPTTFAGLITNDSTKTTSMWNNTFDNTIVATQCPAGMAQYITGYEGSTNGTTWNTRVSCEPCPTGTYKDVVGNQACSACPVGTYMADTGATSCTACPALDTGYAYADGTGWTGWNQCSEQMRPTNCAGGYLTKTASSASAWGTAVSTLTAAGGYKVTGSGNNTVCSACGAGYYSPSGVNTCTACASGLTTIGYGPGADEAADCGHKFHAGDGIVYLRSVKKTTPSLNVRIGNAVFYGNMSTLENVMSAGSTRKLKINNGGTIYHVHDDSVDLPSGYTQVAYVQSSGNQAIDTGIIMTNAHEVRAKFNPSALSKYLYGSVSSGNSTSYTAYLSSAGNWRFGNRTIAIPTSANTLYESVQNSSGVTINGVSKGTYASTTFTSPNSLVLFGSHSTANAVSPNFSGKVYYIKIYNNGDVVFDGVPAKRNSDNVCGLYDMANNVFYASHTATAFICP